MNEVIVLAGGFGTRLRAVVADLPKPMAPISGRPFLAFLIEHLIRQGARRIILSLGYKADDVTRYFGSEFMGADLVHVVEDEPLGTGGAVRACLPQVRGDHVLIVNGDTFLNFDLSALEQMWMAGRAPVIVARKLEDASRYGALRVDGDRVTGFSEKGVRGAGLVNAGTYLFPVAVADEFPPARRFSLEGDFLSGAVERMKFRAFVTDDYFIDIGIPEDYARAQAELPSLFA